MPTFTVDIDLDASEILERLRDNDIVDEVYERRLEGKFKLEHELMNEAEILDLLRDTSDFLRKNDKLNLALGIDDLIKELSL